MAEPALRSDAVERATLACTAEFEALTLTEVGAVLADCYLWLKGKEEAGQNAAARSAALLRELAAAQQRRVDVMGELRRRGQHEAAQAAAAVAAGELKTRGFVRAAAAYDEAVALLGQPPDERAAAAGYDATPEAAVIAEAAREVRALSAAALGAEQGRLERLALRAGAFQLVQHNVAEAAAMYEEVMVEGGSGGADEQRERREWLERFDWRYCWMVAARGDRDQMQRLLSRKSESLPAMVADAHAVASCTRDKLCGAGYRGSGELMRAAEDGNAATLAALLEAGVSPDSPQERDGRGTSLVVAAKQGDGEACELLLLFGADPNAVGKRTGATALHSAAIHGHHKVAAALLSGGADGSIRNNDGDTPSDVARWFDRTAVLKVMTAFEAEAAGLSGTAKAGLMQTAAIRGYHHGIKSDPFEERKAELSGMKPHVLKTILAELGLPAQDLAGNSFPAQEMCAMIAAEERAMARQ